MSEAAYKLALTMRVRAGGPDPVPFGSAADARLRADLHALLAEDAVTQHVWQRARGYMKTTSSAVAATAALLVDAPANSVIQVYATDLDQSRIIMRAVGTIVDHLPASLPTLALTKNSVTRVDNGASIRVETSDAASALGAMDLHMLVLDEVANWPDTDSFRSLWDNVYSGVPKTGDTKVLLVTSAGPIGTFAYERLMTFQKSRHWRYSLAPGKAPWRTDEDLEKQREGLSSLAAFRMFHLNEFTSAQDALVGEEDLAAAVAGGVRERPYDPAHAYVVTADLGTTKDASVITVCHREGSRVVQDAHRRWLPRLGRKVDLPAVRAELAALYHAYGSPVTLIDANQALLMAQDLLALGVYVRPIHITAQYNHACASALQTALEQHRIDLLDVKEQTDELLTVVVRTRTAGGSATVALDSSGSNHDDQADVLAMAAESLMSRPAGGPLTTNAGAFEGGLQVRRGAGDQPVLYASRETVQRGPRDLTTPSYGQPRKVTNQASRLDRFRSRFGWGREVEAAPPPAPRVNVKRVTGSTTPTDAAPPAGKRRA